VFDDFVAQLGVLNLKNVRYLVSYDGRLGTRSYGKPLPAKLRLTLVEIEAGRSSQATLLGRDEMTVESLYLSPALAEELQVHPKIRCGDSAVCQRGSGKSIGSPAGLRWTPQGLNSGHDQL
jgi:hypothetical protein